MGLLVEVAGLKSAEYEQARVSCGSSSVSGGHGGVDDDAHILDGDEIQHSW